MRFLFVVLCVRFFLYPGLWPYCRDCHPVSGGAGKNQLPQIFKSYMVFFGHRLYVILALHFLGKSAELSRNFPVESGLGLRVPKVVIPLHDTQFKEKAVLRLLNPLLKSLLPQILHKFIRVLIGRKV